MKHFSRSRRKRPDIKEAKTYLRLGYGGGMAASDYVSMEERKQRLQRLAAEIPSMLRIQFASVRRLDLVVLKCHLLLEFMLNQFIDLVAHTEGALDDARLTFKQKQAVVHMLGLPADPLLLPTLDLLNTIRNQVAHTLALDRNRVDNLIRMNSENPSAFRKLTDAKRVAALKQITRFYCGMILGAIEAKHDFEFDEATVEQLAAPDRPPGGR